MPNPNAIVSNLVRLSGPPEQAAAEALRGGRRLSVELDGGRSVLLDPENPRSPGFAQVLAGLEKLGRPVYLELDPETEMVAQIYIPRVGHIVALRPIDEGYDIELDLSHGRHLLRRDSADIAAFEAVAREALAREIPVILSENESHEILDIRFFRPGPERRARFLPDRIERRRERPWFEAVLVRLWYWRFWPWRWRHRGCVSAEAARDAFEAMAATTCDPVAVPTPCIPFVYPDDGCWARAHEMCRLMIAMGLNPRKLWISGYPLITRTGNHPHCHVVWGWHVAPILCVRNDRFWIWHWVRPSRTMVIDPALFPGPVTVAEWKGVQGNPAALLTYTAASDFKWGETDPTYSKTDEVLADHRLLLLNRSNGPDGPPPYDCPEGAPITPDIAVEKP